VLSVLEYDAPHQTLKLGISPPQQQELKLLISHGPGITSVPGAESIIPVGATDVDVVFSFTDDELLDAMVDIVVNSQPDDVEIGYEYANIARPLAITSFSYEQAYDRLRSWVNISGETTVTVNVPPGVSLNGPAEITLEESGYADFPIKPVDGFTNGTAVVHAEDVYGNTHQRSTQIFGPGGYADNTLYIYAPEAHAGVNQPVTVIVATGRPAYPLQFMSCVSVTIDSQGSYVPGSFNVGVPAGDRLDIDGLWAAMGIPTGQLLDLGDSFMPGPGEAIDGGRRAYEFAIVSMGPYPAADAAGVLFNFQLRFSEPGEYRLGLRDLKNDFDMTYYASASGENHFWGTLMADTNGSIEPSIFGYHNTIVIE
jgi:hypothetical protein